MLFVILDLFIYGLGETVEVLSEGFAEEKKRKDNVQIVQRILQSKRPSYVPRNPDPQAQPKRSHITASARR